MSIDWDRLGQQRFDRVVEALVSRRFGDSVRVVNGRGGDDGIDIEITGEGRLHIQQLKYFPEGFSGGYSGTRRRQIRKSFDRAAAHNPDEWTLVVPCVLTTAEAAFAKKLGGPNGPTITIVDRAILDSWLADDPDLDSYFQRDPATTLERYARVFQQERAALLGGTEDLAARVGDLGGIADTADPDWTMDFSRTSDAVSVTVRPQHPGAALTNPLLMQVRLGELDDERADLRKHLERTLGYGSSEPIRIPREVVETIHIEGPNFLAGEQPPGDIEVHRISNTPGVGKPLEVRIFDKDDKQVASWIGRITHADRGTLGGSIEAQFCEGRLQARFRLPHGDPSTTPSENASAAADVSFKTVQALPSAVRDVLCLYRQLECACKLKLYIDGLHATTLGGLTPMTLADYDEELLIVEQFADDLDAVQRHCGTHFNIPNAVTPAERVDVRVARILIEGGIVASPKAPWFTLPLTGQDSPRFRETLRGPTLLLQQARDPYEITVAGRTMPIGTVYALHPGAVAVNADEAIEALEAGTAEGFALTFQPGDDQFFYLALANRPPDELYNKPAWNWGLVGIEQPDLPAEKPEDTSE